MDIGRNKTKPSTKFTKLLISLNIDFATSIKIEHLLCVLASNKIYILDMQAESIKYDITCNNVIKLIRLANRNFASYSRDGHVQVWNIEYDAVIEVIARTPLKTSIQFDRMTASPDGRYLAAVCATQQHPYSVSAWLFDCLNGQQDIRPLCIDPECYKIWAIALKHLVFINSTQFAVVFNNPIRGFTYFTDTALDGAGDICNSINHFNGFAVYDLVVQNGSSPWLGDFPAFVQRNIRDLCDLHPSQDGKHWLLEINNAANCNSRRFAIMPADQHATSDPKQIAKFSTGEKLGVQWVDNVVLIFRQQRQSILIEGYHPDSQTRFKQTISTSGTIKECAFNERGRCLLLMIDGTLKYANLPLDKFNQANSFAELQKLQALAHLPVDVLRIVHEYAQEPRLFSSQLSAMKPITTKSPLSSLHARLQELEKNWHAINRQRTDKEDKELVGQLRQIDNDMFALRELQKSDPTKSFNQRLDDVFASCNRFRKNPLSRELLTFFEQVSLHFGEKKEKPVKRRLLG